MHCSVLSQEIEEKTSDFAFQKVFFPVFSLGTSNLPRCGINQYHKIQF